MARGLRRARRARRRAGAPRDDQLAALWYESGAVARAAREAGHARAAAPLARWPRAAGAAGEFVESLLGKATRRAARWLRGGARAAAADLPLYITGCWRADATRFELRRECLVRAPREDGPDRARRLAAAFEGLFAVTRPPRSASSCAACLRTRPAGTCRGTPTC